MTTKTASKNSQVTISIEKPVSMVDQIRKTLSDAIVNGKLSPGQLIKEKDLQKWFGVSRAPIREAIRLLEADELVVVDAYRKKYVRRITFEYLNDIIPIAACLEGFAARSALKFMTKKQLKLLEQINDNMEYAYTKKKYVECAKQNFTFHQTFIRTAQNKALRRAAKSATKPIIWFWITQIYFKQSTIILLSIKEHKAIIESFKNGNANETEQVVRNHILNILGRSIEGSKFDENGDFIYQDVSGIFSKKT